MILAIGASGHMSAAGFVVERRGCGNYDGRFATRFLPVQSAVENGRLMAALTKSVS